MSKRSGRQIVYPRALPWVASGLCLFAIGLLVGLGCQAYPELAQTIFSENGPVETGEMIALLLAMAVFTLRAVRFNDPVGVICISIAFILANALVRETPRCDSSYFDGGICFAKESWKIWTIAFAAIVAGVALWTRRRHLQAAISARLLHMVWPIWVAPVLLVSAEVGENFGSLAMEEILELLAYLFLVTFGIWMHRKI